jgi:hypothetical protein
MAPSFGEFRFGWISAETERQRDPSLLDEGFYAHDDSVRDLLSGNRFLVLGYKGSGKTAIAEHIDLTAHKDPNLFVNLALLREFPFEDVPQVIVADSATNVRTSLSWSILCLIKLIESYSRDEGLHHQHPNLADAVHALKRLGLLPRRRFTDLVLKSREINLAVALPRALETSLTQRYEQATLTLSQMRDHLLDIVCKVQGPVSHVLILDGLDEIFYDFESHYEIIASLLHEVNSLNAAFDRTGSCAHIIIMCRTDLFERLPSINMNRIRDFATVLDWYDEPRDPHKSNLFRFATHRARLSGYEGQNVIRDYLPKRLERASSRSNAGPKPVNTYRFLLDHTRHTPRDFQRVLHYIQMHSSGTEYPSRRAIFSGLRRYSTEYFLPELRGELSGYFSPPEVRRFLDLIGSLRKRTFSVTDLDRYRKSSRNQVSIDTEEALRVLFTCSAVGNVVRQSRPEGRDRLHYTFRYRNPHASLNLDEPIILHRGVWKAMNAL